MNSRLVTVNIKSKEHCFQVGVVDGSIALAGEVECTDEQNEEDNSQLLGDNSENVDETSSCKSGDSTHGDDDDSSNIECNICGKTYKRKAHLLKHLMSHKMNKSDGDVTDVGRERHCLFVCNKCGKRFSKSKTLQSHVNDGSCVKEEVRNVPMFSYWSFITDHISRIHSVDSVRRHFRVSTILRNIWRKFIHLSDHTCVRYAKKRSRASPIGTPICNHTTKVKKNLLPFLEFSVSSTQVHFTDDTYKCGDCGQGFKSKVYLNKHRKSVHTVNEHDCPHCAMKFFNTTKFEYHLKSHDENKSKLAR